MSAPAPSRRSRGRVLIVGDPATWRARLPQFTESPEFATDLFDAIGRLGTHRPGDARSPVTGMLVPDSALDGSGPFAIDAVRQLEPGLVIIRLADADGGAAGVADAWFDATLTGSITSVMLEQLLGPGIAEDGPDHVEPAPALVAAAPPDPFTASPEPIDAQPFASAPSTPASLPLTEIEPEPETETELESASIAEPTVDAATDVMPDVMPEPATAPAATESQPATVHRESDDALGDIDLVRAILDSELIAEAPDAGGRLHDGPILERALTIIHQRTGWTDLAYHAPTDAEPSGRLTASGADERDLEAWADWLAPWLELDQRHRQYRLASFRDDLTGAWNRRYFTRFLDDTLQRARAVRRPVSVMVFDIDDFKRYNDQYGHEVGDTVLVETVTLLQSVIRQCDRVCRIGGDEFVVVFADFDEPRELGSEHPADVTNICRRFQQQVATMQFRTLGLDAPGALSISAGLAAYPWDAHDATTLLRLADERALASKRRGKNMITFGPGAPSA